MICFNVNTYVLVTSQKQILTELKSNWPVILTGDLLAVILSPVAVFITYIYQVYAGMVQHSMCSKFAR